MVNTLLATGRYDVVPRQHVSDIPDGIATVRGDLIDLNPFPPSCPSSDDELADSFVQLPTPRGVNVESPSSQLTTGNSSSPVRGIAVSSSNEIKDGLFSTE